jgi:hypothetical protein
VLRKAIEVTPGLPAIVADGSHLPIRDGCADLAEAVVRERDGPERGQVVAPAQIEEHGSRHGSVRQRLPA